MDQYQFESLPGKFSGGCKGREAAVHFFVNVGEHPLDFFVLIKNIGYECVGVYRRIRLAIEVGLHVSLSLSSNFSGDGSGRWLHWLPVSPLFVFRLRAGRGTSCLWPRPVRTWRFRPGSKSWWGRWSFPSAESERAGGPVRAGGAAASVSEGDRGS